MTDRRKTIGFSASKDDGQSLAEFGLILGLVVLVSVAGVQLLGGNISQQLQAYVTPMSATNPNPGTAASPYENVSYDTTPASALTAPGRTGNTVSEPTPSSPPSPQTDLSAGILPFNPSQNLALTGTPDSIPNSVQTPAGTQETTPTAITAPNNNQSDTDQSAWGNASPGCVGCTQNMTGNWGW